MTRKMRNSYLNQIRSFFLKVLSRQLVVTITLTNTTLRVCDISKTQYICYIAPRDCTESSTELTAFHLSAYMTYNRTGSALKIPAKDSPNKYQSFVYSGA